MRTIEFGAAGISNEGEDVATLLTECRVHGQDSFDEATALFGMRALAGLSTEDAVSHGSLGAIVRRLDALDVEESPERVDAFEEVLAGLGGLRMEQVRRIRDACECQ